MPARESVSAYRPWFLVTSDVEALHEDAWSAAAAFPFPNLLQILPGKGRQAVFRTATDNRFSYVEYGPYY